MLSTPSLGPSARVAGAVVEICPRTVILRPAACCASAPNPQPLIECRSADTAYEEASGVAAFEQCLDDYSLDYGRNYAPQMPVPA